MESFVSLLANMLIEHSEAILKWGVGIFASTIAGAITIFSHQRVKHEEDKHRETHTLELFKALSTNNPQLQLAAASVLVERLKRLMEKRNKTRIDRSEEDSIEYALHSLLKSEASEPTDRGAASSHRGVSPQLAKYIGEQLVRLNLAQPLVGGRPPDVEREEATYLKWLDRKDLPSEPPLKRFDWQKVKIVEAWWPGLDARGVDFFKAELMNCGMRYANLKDAVFYEANLSGTKLNCANLSGANFYDANIERVDFRGARLSRADFSHAKNIDKARWQNATYCPETKFPAGFAPADNGMSLVVSKSA